MNTLYLPSTPLNFALALAHASHNDGEHVLCFLDQRRPSAYLEVLESLDNPFAAMNEQLVPAGLLDRKRERATLFRQIDRWLVSFDIQAVAAGSDRRVEFQYARSRRESEAAGIYLDDGLYTYMGRPWRPVKDRLDGLLKKLVYGSWWTTPRTLGSSHWIDEAWVFMPDEVHPLLREKKLRQIPADWFNNPLLRHFGEAVLQRLAAPVEKISSASQLLLLTHPNNADKIPGYQTRIMRLLEATDGEATVAKYHPRVGNGDPFGVLEKGVSALVPAQAAFEFLLPLLPVGSRVVGDVSTALLTARWLRPDLDIVAMLGSLSELERRVLPIMKRAGIRIMAVEGEETCIS